ncbi:MAG TPA: DUF5522 domain-containing protein [Pyrinomonadaceae bacterium]
MNESRDAPTSLVEGEDYYLENGLMVLTARYHLRRGYCCDNGCRHCPYDECGVGDSNNQQFSASKPTD